MLDGPILCEVDSVFVALLLLEFYGLRFFDYIAIAGSMQSALVILMYVCLFHTCAKASSNTHSCTQYAVFYIFIKTALKSVILLGPWKIESATVSPSTRCSYW